MKNPIVRNTLAVLAGLVVGIVVNSSLVNVGPFIIPLPEGADVSSLENIKASIPLFEPKNYLFPFLGHALGTLAGAYIAALLAVSHQLKFALGIGFFFLLGGITVAVMIGGPIWFLLADLIVAYIPMGLLGAKLAGQKGSGE